MAPAAPWCVCTNGVALLRPCATCTTWLADAAKRYIEPFPRLLVLEALPSLSSSTFFVLHQSKYINILIAPAAIASAFRLYHAIVLDSLGLIE